MLTREITFPVAADRLWEALADPSAWLGAEVEWDLRPGGAATFRGDDGDRAGRVDEVLPGRHLSFHWWPEAERAKESEVTWDLEPTQEGTRLTITERRTASTAQASAAGWTGWDARLAGLWISVEGGRAHGERAHGERAHGGRAHGGGMVLLTAERGVPAGLALVRLGA